MKSQITILSIIFLFFSIKPYAQIVKLSALHYKEVWQNKIPISGGLKVGVLYGVSENMKVQKSFFVKLPKGTYNQLCVKFNSRDGKFFADMQYDISKVKEGLIELEYPTKYWQSIQAYTTDKIAILANISKLCNEGDQILVPASWNKAEIQKGINIILNSDKNPKIEIFDLDSKTASEITCEN
ncbi:MAG: hypothetical protein IPO92_18780 [Saprospiraceae bacterium]|nr:hypothetical protein [Saprospiraceae bacterium]